MIFNIAYRELRSLFLSPLAWVMLAVMQGILAYIFLTQLERFFQLQPQLAVMQDAPGVTDIVIAPLLGNAAFIFLLMIPLLTMRLISEERRNKTLSLLLSAPLSMTEIILGKFLAMVVFIALMVSLLALMPFSLLMGTSVDLGVLVAGLLGLFLLATSFSALGLYMSCLTAQPTIAAVSSFGALLLLWIIDWSGSVENTADTNVLSYLSMVRHYEPMLRGVLNSGDFIYYLLVIVLFVSLSIHRLDAERLSH